MFLRMQASAMLRALEACLLTTSKDETRANLNSMQFETLCGESSYARIVSTDGHRLTKWEVAKVAPVGCDLAPEATLIARADVVRMVRLLKETIKANGKLGDDETTATLETVSVAVHHGGDAQPSAREMASFVVASPIAHVGTSAVTMKPVEHAEFPPYKQVIPALRPDRVAPWVSLNACYLADCAKVAEKGIEIRFAGDDTSPIIVTAPRMPEWLVVIMPMREDMPADIAKHEKDAGNDPSLTRNGNRNALAERLRVAEETIQRYRESTERLEACELEARNKIESLEVDAAHERMRFAELQEKHRAAFQTIHDLRTSQETAEQRIRELYTAIGLKERTALRAEIATLTAECDRLRAQNELHATTIANVLSKPLAKAEPSPADALAAAWARRKAG